MWPTLKCATLRSILQNLLWRTETTWLRSSKTLRSTPCSWYVWQMTSVSFEKKELHTLGWWWICSGPNGKSECRLQNKYKKIKSILKETPDWSDVYEYSELVLYFECCNHPQNWREMFKWREQMISFLFRKLFREWQKVLIKRETCRSIL